MSYDLVIILAYGITFGILGMTIIYTFIRFVASKEIIYISYCFMQIFSLGYIALYSQLFFINTIAQDIFLVCASFSAVIFALSFYEGKFFPSMTTTKELFINTILLNVVILTSFYHYMLFEYFPYTVIYSILFLSVIFNIKDGFKPTRVYVIGWSILCFLLFVFNFKQVYLSNQYLDIVLLAFAVEAILFTISVSYKYGNLKQQSKSYEDMLLQQAKMAQSGEMIANITHQFRQPLNNISYILINIKKRFENKKLDETYFHKKITQADTQLQFLSTTIDHFKDFYTPSKQKENFLIKEAIDSSITVLSAELKKRNITLDIQYNVNEDININGIKNELSQVILAILSNASDALKEIETPLINIKIDANDAEIIISISNNGKQIDKRDINKIFEPYFSTKKEGTGIGLYLSKMIIKRSFDGDLKVENNDKGVKFTLMFDKTV
ncbi:MAG: signal transduction histidine kinase [Arcobacteraceae bacterium]